ncbi:hypothetical protein [Dactylosporangium sp. CA-139066]|uniref:hypothetical protein n=1 Tax=Dactylosporangium sp. CA-139066 TaxID=3239930 RepID=UPI003D913CB7
MAPRVAVGLRGGLMAWRLDDSAARLTRRPSGAAWWLSGAAWWLSGAAWWLSGAAWWLSGAAWRRGCAAW